MTHAAMEMSGSAESAAPSDRAALDAAVDVLREHASEFATLAPAAKAAMLRECIGRLLDEAPAWVATASRARGLEGALVAEEWIAGIAPTMRMMRLMAESLDAIARRGKPALGAGARARPDGRLEIDVFPASPFDRLLFRGVTARLRMLPGVTRDSARDAQAAFYDRRDPEGGVSLILGAGNVSSIPPMDVMTRMFGAGHVCVLKMNPVNEWVGRVFAPFVDRGYLRVVYGGGDVGTYLVEHPGVDDVHITGSERTHDRIVWGPPGPERERRLAANDPVLRKPITSELGNVSPVAVVPGRYSDGELRFQARNVATMVANNASFNCNAAKMLITSSRWAQRERFLALVRAQLARIPTRRAYYPGARDRYERLLAGHDRVEQLGEADDDRLAWALVTGLDSGDEGERLFREEPFCVILSETTLDAPDAAAFLAAATSFMNDRLWGSLNACIVIPPRVAREAGAALDRAVDELRYGTVGINHWPALGYALVTPPWGGHPSATLRDIQSGLGWVHNTFMLDGIEKAVVRGPITSWPDPLWFSDNGKAVGAAPRYAAFEAAPAWRKLPGVVLRAI